MRLLRLSRLSLVACTAALAVLVALGAYAFARMQDKQAEIAALMAFEKRVDDFSATTDSLLLYPKDPSVWRAYRREAEAIREGLIALGEQYPEARKAAKRVELMVAAVERFRATAPDAPAATQPPLGVAPRTRAAMQLLANHGVVLDAALQAVQQQRQQAIARQVNWIAGGLAGATLLFGLVAVAALGTVHRRLAGPVSALVRTVERLRSGEGRARAPALRSHDELALLASELNQLLDEQAHARSALQQYKEMVEASADMCAITDRDYRYVLVNQSYAETYGLAREQILGARIPDVIGEETWQQLRPSVDRLFAGERLVFEHARDIPGSGRRHLLMRYYPILARDGSVQYGAAIHTDITELRRAESELSEQARLLDIAGRVARLGGWSIELDEGVVRWSDVVAEIHAMPHGYAPTLQEGIEFYAPEFRDRIRRAFEACARDGIPYDEQLQILDAHGRRVWVRAVGEPVYDANGSIVRVQGAFQDVSTLKRQEARLYQYRELIERSNDQICVLDSTFRYVLVNDAYARRQDLEPAEIEGRHVSDVLEPDFYDAEVRPRLLRCLAGEPQEYETRTAIGSQGDRDLLIRYHPMADDGDQVSHIGVTITDVTELKRAEQDLNAALEMRQTVINALPAHIALLDGDGRILDVNEQWRTFGRENDIADPDYGVGTNYIRICDQARADTDDGDSAAQVRQGLRQVLRGERAQFTLEYPCHAPDEPRWFRLMANRLGHGNAPSGEPGAVVMHVDVTERKLAEQELNRLAYEDPLTGLLSRNGFIDRLGRRLAGEGWQPAAALVLLNLRNQRDINDAYGYEVGDQLLIEVAGRLRAVAGEAALLGRVGGDEFVVFLPGDDPRTLEEFLMALRSVFDRPFALEPASVAVDGQFGYTVLGERRRRADELIREAAVAMVTAAQEGQNWGAYTGELDREIGSRVELTRELLEAIAQDQFELHLQPKVSLADGSLHSAEALIRWRHPERGLQSPGLFMPVAERSQLIAPIGDWVVREACRLLSEWQQEGLDLVRIAINVSVVQLTVGGFATTVRDALAAYAVRPGALTLEITESVFGRESEELLVQLRELHELGLRLSLDDFGTGYSSLLYLQRYPFDEIKIDQGFVRDLRTEAYSRHIVETILNLAEALGAEVVAEGVEDAETAQELLSMGCRIGQGFHYSVPLEEEDFRWLLRQRRRLPLARQSRG